MDRATNGGIGRSGVRRGLLFVAMVFASAALTAGLVAAADAPADGALHGVWLFGHETGETLATVYGCRMAAVFTLSASTISARLDLVPRWLIVLGFGWFGPRGLASVVFGLLIVEELPAHDPRVQTVLSTIAITVVLSVISHGVSARPLSAWMQRQANAAAASEVPS